MEALEEEKIWNKLLNPGKEYSVVQTNIMQYQKGV